MMYLRKVECNLVLRGFFLIGRAISEDVSLSDVFPYLQSKVLIIRISQQLKLDTYLDRLCCRTLVDIERTTTSLSDELLS